MIRAGKYRHRIHIQEPVDTQDLTTGVITRTWQTVTLDTGESLDSVPAEVLTGQGRELHAAGTKLAETKARINCRWFPGLSEEMRIRWDGKIYDIISMETDVTARREYRIHGGGGLADQEEASAVDTTFWIVDGGVFVVDGGIQVVDTL